MKKILYIGTIIMALMTILTVVTIIGLGNRASVLDDTTINIVTSFYPMYIATSNIINGADNVTLKCLASPEVGCLHDYQLTVNDMITLEKADIFVINGGGMESFLDKAINAYPDMMILNASEELFKEEEADLHEHEEHDHSHEENPHAWVSVSLHIKQIEKITQGLKEYDPSNADIYEKNSKKYIESLDNLKVKMHEKLDFLTNKNVVMFHEAFHYFAEEFGLNIVAVIEREPGTSPSAKDVAEIIDMIRNENVNAIFVEPQYLKTAANTISNETDVAIYELDPIVSGTFENNAYLENMNKNLEVLLEALK